MSAAVEQKEISQAGREAKGLETKKPENRLIGWISGRPSDNKGVGTVGLDDDRHQHFPIRSTINDLDVEAAVGFSAYFNVEVINGIQQATDVEIISREECAKLGLSFNI